MCKKIWGIWGLLMSYSFLFNLIHLETTFTLFIVVHQSVIISNLLSVHKNVNYDGTSMNSNANLSYMWKTFDHADCGPMYTNQAMEMTQTPEDTNKYCTPLQNVSIYLSPGFECSWWKAKSNIRHAKRCGKIQPMRLDMPRATILQ